VQIGRTIISVTGEEGELPGVFPYYKSGSTVMSNGGAGAPLRKDEFARAETANGEGELERGQVGKGATWIKRG